MMLLVFTVFWVGFLLLGQETAATTVTIRGTVQPKNPGSDLTDVDISVDGETNIVLTQSTYSSHRVDFEITISPTGSTIVINIKSPGYVPTAKTFPANLSGVIAYTDVILLEKGLGTIMALPINNNLLTLEPSTSDALRIELTIPVESEIVKDDGTLFNGSEVRVISNFFNPAKDVFAIAPGNFMTADEKHIQFLGILHLIIEDPDSGEELFVCRVGHSCGAVVHAFVDSQLVPDADSYSLWTYARLGTWDEISRRRRHRQTSDNPVSVGSIMSRNIHETFAIAKTETEAKCFLNLRLFTDETFEDEVQTASDVIYQPYVLVRESYSAMMLQPVGLQASSCLEVRCSVSSAMHVDIAVVKQTTSNKSPLITDTVAVSLNDTSMSVNHTATLDDLDYRVCRYLGSHVCGASIYCRYSHTCGAILLSTVSLTGPFFPNEASCQASGNTDNAVWFAVQDIE